MKLMQEKQAIWQQHVITVNRTSEAMLGRMQLLRASLCNAQMDRCCLQHQMAIMQRQMVRARTIALVILPASCAGTAQCCKRADKLSEISSATCPLP